MCGPSRRAGDSSHLDVPVDPAYWIRRQLHLGRYYSDTGCSSVAVDPLGTVSRESLGVTQISKSSITS